MRTTVILFCFLISSCSTQKVNTTPKISCDFPFQDLFEHMIDGNKNIVEDSTYPDILESPEEAAMFFKSFVSLKIPRAEISTIYVGEDKYKKTWFITSQIQNAVYKNWIYFIVKKNDCAILIFHGSK